MSEFDFDEMLADIKTKSTDIPFGNSQFQWQAFVFGQPAHRQYRQLLLEMDGICRKLTQCRFRRERLEVDIEELASKIDDEKLTKFEVRRLNIDLAEKQWQLADEEKLIGDSLVDLTTMYKKFKTLSPVTRAEFEQAEGQYWQQRLIADGAREMLERGSISAGTIESLEKIGFAVGRNSNGQLVIGRPEQGQISKPDLDAKAITE